MPKKGQGKTKRASGQGPSRATAIRLATASRSAGVSPTKVATLTYPLYVNPGASVAGVNAYQFRMNSLFDPDFTGTGGQPTDFDQWMALYTRYRVLSCHIDIDVVNVTSVTYVRACCAPSADSSPTLTWNGIAGLRDAHIPSSARAGYVCNVSKTYLVCDAFGINEEALMSENNYTGTAGTNPTSVAYLNIGIATSATTDVTQCIGYMKFGVRFEEPAANNISVSTKSTLTFGPPEPYPPSVMEAARAYVASAEASARSQAGAVLGVPAAVRPRG
jgi:hypothetical protein